METGTKRPSRGRARRAILESTLEVIAAEGIDAVTHRRVAALAGVSPGSTTHHFTSREDLIRAAFRFYLETANRVLASMQTRVAESHADPVVRVRELLCEVVDREFGDERLVRAEYEMILYATTDSELGEFLRETESGWVAHMAGLLEAAGRSEPFELGRILVNLVRGYELERLIDRDLGLERLRKRIDTVLGMS